MSGDDTPGTKPPNDVIPAQSTMKEPGPYRHAWAGRPLFKEEHHSRESFVAASDTYPRGLEGILALYFQKISQLTDEVAQLSFSMTQMASQLSGLTETIQERPVVSPSFLSDLAAEHLEVSRLIPIILEQYQNEAVARWPEVEATGIGASELEAIESLRADIVELYDDLSSTDPEQLSRQTANVLSLLSSVVQKREGS